ncbi:SE1832 family protein [Salinibacillus kushneri]
MINFEEKIKSLKGWGWNMATKKEIEQEIEELKMDYIRIQGDLDKLEAVGGKVSPLEKTLERMEQQLSDLRKQLTEVES